jgi:hypothetical protein
MIARIIGNRAERRRRRMNYSGYSKLTMGLFLTLLASPCAGELVRVRLSAIITEARGIQREDLSVGETLSGVFTFDDATPPVWMPSQGQQYAAGRYLELSTRSGFFARTNYATVAIVPRYTTDEFYVITTPPRIRDDVSGGSGNGVVDDIEALYHYDFDAKRDAIEESLRLGFPPPDVSDVGLEDFDVAFGLFGPNLLSHEALTGSLPTLAASESAHGLFVVNRLDVYFQLTSLEVVPEPSPTVHLVSGVALLGLLHRPIRLAMRKS